MHIKIIFGLTLIVSLLSSTSVFSQEENSSLENFIKKKRNYNKNCKNGYSLLLYNGNEEDAREIYTSFKDEYENIDIKLTYDKPDWKVMTKVYSSKIKAERVLLTIKEEYPNIRIL